MTDAATIAEIAHPSTPHNCTACEDAEIDRLVAVGCEWHWAVLRVIDQQHSYNRRTLQETPR